LGGGIGEVDLGLLVVRTLTHLLFWVCQAADA